MVRDEPLCVSAALSYLVITMSTNNYKCSNAIKIGGFLGKPNTTPSKSFDESTNDTLNDSNYRGPWSNNSGSKI